jgi:hypothetical protein
MKWRAWCWRKLADAAGLVMRWANRRAAKACGCESCQLMYDPRAQARVIEVMLARVMGGKAPARADRRPS